MFSSPTRPDFRLVAGIVVGVVVAMILILHGMGRTPFGPDGRFGWWEGDIWSAGCSQRVLDPYALTHITHGFLFYGLLWLVGRRWPVATRFLLALGLEAGWEILENSPFLIERYRQTTMALGYFGDSILNSVSDLAMMSLGFLIASRARLVVSLVLVVLLEVGCLWWVRDNLSLNILMLIHPIEAVKEWQMNAVQKPMP